MRQLNGIYTQAFNRNHCRVGHLLQGRFKAIIIEKQAHLLELSRYIILNPVHAGMVQRPEDYPWSSYLATLGQTKVSDFLTVQWLLENFSPQITQAQQLYREFVNKEEQPSPWGKLTSQVYLGSDNFIQQVKNLTVTNIDSKEIPLNHRHAGRPVLADVLALNAEQSKEQRNKLIYKAHVDYGYKLKQIAEVLGIHYTTVSKIVKKNSLSFKT